MISALKTGGNSCILAEGPGKASYHRNVTVKENLSGHVAGGGIHIWLLWKLVEIQIHKALFQPYDSTRISRVKGLEIWIFQNSQ